MTLWLTALALAGVPDSVRPAAAAADIGEQFAAWQAQTGDDSPAPACRPLWPDEAVLCFKVVDEGTRRYVTDEDLAAWKTDLEGLEATLRRRASGPLVQSARVEDSELVYWSAAAGDGWSVRGALAPEALAEVVGEPLLVALPTDEVLIAWKQGDAELDKIMAVGVTRMYEEGAGVSPVVHKWEDGRWSAYAEATKSEP